MDLCFLERRICFIGLHSCSCLWKHERIECVKLMMLFDYIILRAKKTCTGMAQWTFWQWTVRSFLCSGNAKGDRYVSLYTIRKNLSINITHGCSQRVRVRKMPREIGINVYVVVLYVGIFLLTPKYRLFPVLFHFNQYLKLLKPSHNFLEQDIESVSVYHQHQNHQSSTLTKSSTIIASCPKKIRSSDKMASLWRRSNLIKALWGLQY